MNAFPLLRRRGVRVPGPADGRTMLRRAEAALPDGLIRRLGFLPRYRERENGRPEAEARALFRPLLAAMRLEDPRQTSATLLVQALTHDPRFGSWPLVAFRPDLVAFHPDRSPVNFINLPAFAARLFADVPHPACLYGLRSGNGLLLSEDVAALSAHALIHLAQAADPALLQEATSALAQAGSAGTASAAHVRTAAPC